MPPHGPVLSSLDTLCCSEADEPTNLEQPTLNHVQSDTMASAVLADLTHALQGTNQGNGSAMEESETDVGSLDQLLLYADEHYLAGKLPLGDHLGKVLHWIEEYHQRSARKGCLDLRFACARCLEIVCGTIATPASARIVERVTVRSTSACRTILSPRGLPGYSRSGFPRMGTFSSPLLPTISNGTLRTIHLGSNTARRSACSFHPDGQASLKLA
ncbi:15-hydroxyprostaglandin dehydrogenase [Trichonephila clavipes]|uniref:15-hydroxyprostaglandin dehydrogenase n=1 Tax=Trichonephila clavipes TaxID=2585209 RepID=A0A8X6VKG9_TRICX|nr:15-hydroxyprostaglandin dehydrogenase [Trichonephila clavipes]